MARPQASLRHASFGPLHFSRSPLLLVLMLATALCAGPCGAVRLFSFGDSLLDVGNTGLYKSPNNDHPRATFAPYGMNLNPPRVTGRYSDGMVFCDYLADYLGIPWPSPSLSATGDWTYGANFAFGGARILNLSSNTVDVPQQIELFKAHLAKLNLSASDLQEDIALISAGANDYVALIRRSPLNFRRQGPAVAAQVANATVATIQALYATGLRNFLFLNIGTIGCTPAIRAVPFWGRGCQRDANNVVTLANNLIDTRLAGLRTSLPDAAISVIDLFQGFYNISKIMKAPVPQGACCGAPGPINGELQCGKIRFGRNTLDATKPCADPSSRVFWDPIHPGHHATGHLFRMVINGPPSNIRPMNISAMVRAGRMKLAAKK